MASYYNEIDPFAAEWLRQLIKAGHISPGEVDERSIEDVSPKELVGFTQCHFFAGIGVWSYTLRKAGWGDDTEVWTGSCPCQPFSQAGKGKGFADERHLWPSFFHLIEQCRPSVVFGEQVASKAVEPWIDLVQTDMEAMGYAFGCVPFPSASVGAPHIRDRAYWVADSTRSGKRAGLRDCGQGKERWNVTADNGSSVGLDNTFGNGRGEGGDDNLKHDRNIAISVVEPLGMADHSRQGLEKWKNQPTRGKFQTAERSCDVVGTSQTNSFWGSPDWLFCRDGKWRPVESCTFPLVNGATHRVGRLRGYGNAINAEAAKAFIEAFLKV